jgi:hypothetical protein
MIFPKRTQDAIPVLRWEGATTISFKPLIPIGNGSRHSSMRPMVPLCSSTTLVVSIQSALQAD